MMEIHSSLLHITWNTMPYSMYRREQWVLLALCSMSFHFLFQRFNISPWESVHLKDRAGLKTAEKKTKVTTNKWQISEGRPDDMFSKVGGLKWINKASTEHSTENLIWANHTNKNKILVLLLSCLSVSASVNATLTFTLFL